DIAYALTDEWCNSRDIIGGVDGRGVEFDRIGALRGAGGGSCRPQRNGWPRSTYVTTRGDGHESTRGNAPSPRTAAGSPLTAERLGATGLATSGHPACCARA